MNFNLVLKIMFDFLSKHNKQTLFIQKNISLDFKPYYWNFVTNYTTNTLYINNASIKNLQWIYEKSHP